MSQAGVGELTWDRRSISLPIDESKEVVVDTAARVTSKGQVTVPKAVREALGIKAGDEVVFRVEGNRAVLARTPDFLDLAGTIRVPAAKRNVAWDDVIRRARKGRAAARR
jgi:antitoxin PrlF